MSEIDEVEEVTTFLSAQLGFFVVVFAFRSFVFLEILHFSLLSFLCLFVFHILAVTLPPLVVWNLHTNKDIDQVVAQENQEGTNDNISSPVRVL